MNLKLLVFHYGVGMMRNNFIYKVTEDAMRNLIDFGIPQYFLNYICENILRELPKDKKSPKKFSLNDLEFGFVIYLNCCGISIIIFVIEILIFNVRKVIGLKAVLGEIKFQ